MQRHFKGRNSCSMLWALMAAMHDLQRPERTVLGDSVFRSWRRPHKAAIYVDQRKTFIQHVSDAKGSPGGSACTIGTERVVLCDSILCQQMIVQDTSYVCKLGRFSGLVHNGRQLCRMLWTSDRSSGWFASTYVILATVSADSQNPRTVDVPCRLSHLSQRQVLMQHALDVIHS